jgi:hypothetical protein
MSVSRFNAKNESLSENTTPVSLEEKIPSSVQRVLSRFCLDEADLLSFIAKYYHNPESTEIQPLLQNEGMKNACDKNEVTRELFIDTDVAEEEVDTIPYQPLPSPKKPR